MFIVAGASSFLTSYFARRGETKAIRADLDEILDQTRQTTKAAEEIRSEVSRSEWTEKEAVMLRRAKLEELMLAAYQVDEWTDEHRDHVWFNSPEPRGNSPAWRMVMLRALYFPELLQGVLEVTLAARNEAVVILEEAEKMRALKHDPAAHSAAMDGARVRLLAHYKEYVLALGRLETRAGELMKEMVKF